MDTHLRTIYKSITWRITALITTILIIFLFTGDWKLSIGSGIVANVIKAVFYYVHERAWNNVKWGIK